MRVVLLAERGPRKLGSIVKSGKEMGRDIRTRRQPLPRRRARGARQAC